MNTRFFLITAAAKTARGADRALGSRCALRPGPSDLGGTVVELISYEGVTVDPAPQTDHLGYRMMALEVDDMQKTTDYLRTKGVDGWAAIRCAGCASRASA